MFFFFFFFLASFICWCKRRKICGHRITWCVLLQDVELDLVVAAGARHAGLRGRCMAHDGFSAVLKQCYSLALANIWLSVLVPTERTSFSSLA